jgi:hypothetical protein
MGLFHPFLDDEGIEIYGVEAAGHGLDSGLHAASIAGGRPGVLHGNRTYMLMNEDGQIDEAHRPASTIPASVRSIPGTSLPVAVGFGVRDAASAAAIARGAEAVVVGSALVERVRTSLDAAGKATPDTVLSVVALVAELAAGVRSGRRQAAE